MADDLQTQLDSLKAAYRTGTLTVSYDGKTVTYRNADEMRAIISSIESELVSTGAAPVRSIVIRSDKGW
jgi:hypothetical protein